MELGAQDFKYYEESGKKAAAAGAAVGGTAGALYGINKALNNSDAYKQGVNLIDNLKTQKKGIKQSIANAKNTYNRLKNPKAKKIVLDNINNLKKQKKNLKHAIDKTYSGLGPRAIKDLGKKGALKAAAKYGVPAAVATGLAAYGVHKYKHKNESMEVENNMSAINLYETEYDGVYATEDGYLVDEDGNLYDGDGDLIEENAITVDDGSIALYETEYDGVYATEDGYLVDEDGNLYDGDGDLIEENAIILEGEKMNKAKAYGKEAAKAYGAASAGAALASTPALVKVIGKTRRIGLDKFNRIHNFNPKNYDRLQKVMRKTHLKGAAAGLAAYGAYKAYKHFKNKKAAKNESVVTDYDGLA